MKQKNIQKARKKYLQAKELRPEERLIIEKDLQGKDFLYYQSLDNSPLLLGDKYSARATYKKIEPSIRQYSVLGTKRILRYASSIAAIIALVIISALAYQAHGDSQLLLITTTYGERKQVKLPDGSIVILNSLSSMSYKKKMNGKKREVILEGEAYFDIAKDPQKPFVVKINELSIKVLGTKFNVEAYENENYLTTSLFEGYVSINGDNGDTCKLKPGEKGIYQKDKKTLEIVSDESIENEMLWKSGSLNFNNKPLSEIFKVLEREKNIHFIVNDSIGKISVTARFIHNETIDEMLDILGQSLGFEVSKQGNEYSISVNNE